MEKVSEDILHSMLVPESEVSLGVKKAIERRRRVYKYEDSLRQKSYVVAEITGVFPGLAESLKPLSHINDL